MPRQGCQSDAKGSPQRGALNKSMEALGEVVGSGLGHDLGLLEGGGVALLQQDALVVGAAHGQLDGLVLPGGARRAL